MKKLVLALAVVFSVSMFSCGNAEKATEVVDTVAVEEVDSTCCKKDSCDKDSCVKDSCVNDSCVKA